MILPPDDSIRHSVARVRRLSLLGLWAISLLWLLLIPALQLLMGLNAFQAETSARVTMAADRLSTYVASRVNTWEFEDERLRNATREVLRGGQHRVQRIELTSRDRVVLFDVREPAPEPSWLSRTMEAEVSDGRRTVATLAVTYSLYALVRPAEVALLGGAVSMLVLLAIGRMVVRRALDRTLDEMDRRGVQLAARVRELEATREELAVQLRERERDQRDLSRHAASLEMAGTDFAHVAQITTHHMQEPLRTVLSYSQLLLRWHASQGVEDEKAREYMGFIRTGIHRMKVQLRALSTYVSLREADFSPTLMDMGVLMDEVAAAESRVLANAGAILEWSDMPVVVSNPARLRSVLESLIDNSLRWRLPDTLHRIGVSAFQAGSHWVVRVSDNGVPLEQRDPERLFNLLVHDEPGHVAVGLAPARLTVFLLGGSLWAEDTPDGGASFCFTLPEPDE